MESPLPLRRSGCYRVSFYRAITPMHVAAYIEKHPGSPQTVKQLSATIEVAQLIIKHRKYKEPENESGLGS
jgi:hypothetical protein